MRVWHWENRGSWKATLTLVYFNSKPVRSSYCHLCHYFCCLQGKNRLGPESSLSCPTLRAWGVPQEQDLPLPPPLCYPQLLFHTTLLPLLPFLEGKGNCWRLLNAHRTFFPHAWRIGGKRHWIAFLVLSPVPKRERQMGVFTLLSFSIRWKLGVQPVPLACWWAQFTVLRGGFLCYPCRECWGARGAHLWLPLGGGPGSSASWAPAEECCTGTSLHAAR